MIGGSHALADFSDEVFTIISPNLPLNRSLVLNAENDNDRASYCSIRVDATYTHPSTPAVRAHILLKTSYFVSAKAQLDAHNFGLKELQESGIPGVYYIEAKIISKSCRVAPAFSYREEGWYSSILLEIMGPEVTVESSSFEAVLPDNPIMPSIPGRETRKKCKGALDDASLATLANLLDDTANQNFETSYGEPHARHSITYYLDWNATNQQSRSIKIYVNPWTPVPEEVQPLLESLKKYTDFAKNCSSETT